MAPSLLSLIPMVKKTPNIVLLLCLVSGVFLASVQMASAADPDRNNLFGVEWVNLIRRDPLAYAEGMGYNRSNLLGTLPWLEQLVDGVTPVIASAFLNQKAVLLNTDAIESTVPTPTINTDFAYSGDIGGSVLIETGHIPEDAIKVIIDNQFRKELDPKYKGKKFILSKVFNRVGTSLRLDTAFSPLQPGNTFFVAVCFASSQLRSEVQVVNMINQVRAQVVTFNPTLALATESLPRPLPPLFFNDVLQSISREGVAANSDFPLSEHHLRFEGGSVFKSSVIEKFPKADSDLYALWLFYSLVFNDMPLYPTGKGTFSSSNNSIGSTVSSVTGQAHDFLKLTTTSGGSWLVDNSVSKIYGVVFRDLNQDDAYGPGEGCADKVVMVFSKNHRKNVGRAVTNNAGQFSVSLPNQTEYIVLVESGRNREEKNIQLDTDLYVDLMVH